MARLRFETAPQITIFDESVQFKAAANATASLAEFVNASNQTVASISKEGNVLVSGDLTVTGNVVINGNTTTLNTETLVVEDNIVRLNGNSAGASANVNAGIEVYRGADTPVSLRWNEGSDVWQVSGNDGNFLDVATTSGVTTSIDTHNSATTNVHGISDTSALVTLTGSQTLTNKTINGATIGSPTIIGVSPVITLGGDLTGSVTLTDLGNGTLTATIAANSVALGTDTTGNYMADVSAGTGINVSHTPGEGSSASISLNASINDLSDVNTGAVSDGQFLKYLSSNNQWVGAAIPTINNLDDVGDVTITSATTGQFLKWNTNAWVNDAIDLGTDTNGNYMSDVSAGTGVTVSHTAGEGSTATISIGQSVATSANPTFAGATLDAVQVGITAAGEIDTSSGNLTIDSAGGTVTVDDNLVVSGNLTVSGTTTTINTATLSVADNVVTLNSDFTTGSPTENAGIEVLRGNSSTVALRWNETSDKWEATTDGTTYGNVVTTADSGTVSADMIADVLFSAQTANYTLALSDKNKVVEMSNASATTITIAADNSVNFPTGSQITILQTGAGQVTIAGASGVTVNATPGLKVRAQYSAVVALKRAANTWVVTGDLSA